MTQMGLALSPRPSPAAGFVLRPYQAECIEAIKASLAKGRRRLLVAIATGGGKTVVFAQLYRELGLQGRMLVLAHREELLDQAAAKISTANPQLSVGIEQADRRADANTDVLVASVQTLQRKRLEALRPADFALVVTDEAHHAVSPSYMRIYEHLGCLGDAPRIPHIGVTATPNRGDKIGLSAVFEEIAFRRGIRELIREGYLCPVVGYRIASGTDLRDVKTRGGEFVTRELAEAIDTPERNALVVRSYLDRCAGETAIAFCADVRHAENLAEAFDQAHVDAAFVSGETPKDERRDILNRLSLGHLDVVTNCGVLTEGFDEPRVSCLLMARPTKSQLLYTQMVGRGTRLAPGKKQLTVLDLVDNCGRHSLVGAASLFGLPPNFDLEGKDAEEVAKEVAAIAERYPWMDVGKLARASDLKAVATRVDLFADRTPDELEGKTKLAWVPLASGSGFRLSLPAREDIELQSDQLEQWRVTVRICDGRVMELGQCADLAEAAIKADSWVHQHRPDALRMVKATASWRGERASDKQIALLRKLGVEMPPTLTKGQASRMIDLSMPRRGAAARRR